MEGTKTCTGCKREKPLDEFPPLKGGKFGRSSRCRQCLAEHASEINHRTGRHMPYTENKHCAFYLGVHIAEGVLAASFQNVKRMPITNPGYDFVCGKGYKIDVKSACKRYPAHQAPGWMFLLRKNTIADYFLCLAFDSRESLNPEHVWLIPGEEVNSKTGIWMTDGALYLHKWSKWEQPLERIALCCTQMKERQTEETTR